MRRIQHTSFEPIFDSYSALYNLDRIRSKCTFFQSFSRRLNAAASPTLWMAHNAQECFVKIEDPPASQTLRQSYELTCSEMIMDYRNWRDHLKYIEGGVRMQTTALSINLRVYTSKYTKMLFNLNERTLTSALWTGWIFWCISATPTSIYDIVIFSSLADLCSQRAV